MLNNDKDSGSVIVDISDDDDYLFQDFNIDGKILIDKNSVDSLIKENNELRKEIKKLQKFKNTKNNKYNNKFNLKQLFLQCLNCFD